MDLRYKLIITAIVSGFTLDWIILPGLTASDTFVNLLSVGIAGLLVALNFWFFTRIENKWDK